LGFFTKGTPFAFSCDAFQLRQVITAIQFSIPVNAKTPFSYIFAANNYARLLPGGF